MVRTSFVLPQWAHPVLTMHSEWWTAQQDWKYGFNIMDSLQLVWMLYSLQGLIVCLWTPPGFSESLRTISARLGLTRSLPSVTYSGVLGRYGLIGTSVIIQWVYRFSIISVHDFALLVVILGCVYFPVFINSYTFRVRVKNCVPPSERQAWCLSNTAQ